MRIALTGNPNSGKTTMYNALTGRNEKVGNWAGVTVEKKEHTIKRSYWSGEESLVAVDLPGAYSMSPFTSEESVTSSYVKQENPDVIINIVDATNLSRSLFFTTQLLELGIPVVVALNKSDINEKKENSIDVQQLAEMLGCPVIKTSASSADGLHELVSTAAARVGEEQKAPYEDHAELLDKAASEAADRRRFAFVNQIVAQVETRKVYTRDKNFGDKIDAILVNKWLGIPIFAVVMWLVFEISQVWVGTPIADFLVGWLEKFQSWIGTLFAGASPLLYALLVDGVIGGVIAVIGFLPLVMVMYFLIALLEDCGYMSRAYIDAVKQDLTLLVIVVTADKR
ncbi:MAG: ferrous iron transporter B [Clostridia bacterium]|nr:ferrous iron transporter B [Clostridia bacterium]